MDYEFTVYKSGELGYLIHDEGTTQTQSRAHTCKRNLSRIPTVVCRLDLREIRQIDTTMTTG